MGKQLNIKYITLIYLLILLIGTVLPINSVLTTPLDDIYTLQIRGDYLLHALVYIPLPVLLGLYFKKRTREEIRQQTNNIQFWIRLVLFTLPVTVLIELVQLVIPYRAFNINDMMANGVGAILGLMVFLIFGKYFEGMLKSSTD